MTVAQAAEEVKEQFRTEYSNASIDVTVKDKKYCIVIEDALDLDVTDAVKRQMMRSISSLQEDGIL